MKNSTKKRTQSLSCKPTIIKEDAKFKLPTAAAKNLHMYFMGFDTAENGTMIMHVYEEKVKFSTRRGYGIKQKTKGNRKYACNICMWTSISPEEMMNMDENDPAAEMMMTEKMLGMGFSDFETCMKIWDMEEEKEEKSSPVIKTAKLEHEKQT